VFIEISVTDNKLCYHDAMSVKILPIAAQQCRNKLYNKSGTNRSRLMELEVYSHQHDMYFVDVVVVLLL